MKEIHTMFYLFQIDHTMSVNREMIEADSGLWLCLSFFKKYMLYKLNTPDICKVSFQLNKIY